MPKKIKHNEKMFRVNLRIPQEQVERMEEVGREIGLQELSSLARYLIVLGLRSELARKRRRGDLLDGPKTDAS